ncbi:MAG: hypothetical protein WAT81_05570 [Candidatus Moraniibacteriota bacterium]
MPERTLEEKIITLLEKGSREKASILIELQKNDVSAQGVYKALRALKEKEVITLHAKSVSLSLWWIDKELGRLNRMARMYQSVARTSAFLDLRPGEYVKLRFRTLRELELYWTQAFLLIEEELPTSFPTYSIAPHDWFYYARPETDALWLRRQKSRLQRLVITHPLPVDRSVLRVRTKQKMEVLFDENPLKQDEEDYKNVIGKFIFEVKIDTKVNSSFVSWMREHPIVAKQDMSEVDSFLDMRGMFTLKISNAPKKAQKITSKLERYF